MEFIFKLYATIRHLRMRYFPDEKYEKDLIELHSTFNICMTAYFTTTSLTDKDASIAKMIEINGKTYYLYWNNKYKLYDYMAKTGTTKWKYTCDYTSDLEYCSIIADFL